MDDVVHSLSSSSCGSRGHCQEGNVALEGDLSRRQEWEEEEEKGYTTKWKKNMKKKKAWCCYLRSRLSIGLGGALPCSRALLLNESKFHRHLHVVEPVKHSSTDEGIKSRKGQD